MTGSGRLVARVPATSANLGPGFDSIGLALDLYNVVQADPADRVTVEAVGEGAGTLPTGASNLVYQAVARIYDLRGQAPPPLRLRCDNQIPPSRGLGSSSAALAAGLLLGNRLLGDPLTTEQLVDLGAGLEGHPDNIAPCLLGGVRVGVTTAQGVRQCAVRVAAPLLATVYVPDFPMETETARDLLPSSLPIGTAIYNISRAALLVAALSAGRTDLLRTATEDALHQPPRTRVFPAMPRLFAAALDAGAHGVFLSGAGSSILALVGEDRASAVGEAMVAAACAEGISGRVLQARISSEGAVVSGQWRAAGGV